VGNISAPRRPQLLVQHRLDGVRVPFAYLVTQEDLHRVVRLALADDGFVISWEAAW